MSGGLDAAGTLATEGARPDDAGAHVETVDAACFWAAAAANVASIAKRSWNVQIAVAAPVEHRIHQRDRTAHD